MSRIKESLLREQDNLLEYYSGFYDWLERYQPQELDERDIDKMEQDHCHGHNMLTSKTTESVPKNTANITEITISTRRSA